MDKTSLGDRMKNNYENVNRFYLTNFELDKECFRKMINNYKIRQNF